MKPVDEATRQQILRLRENGVSVRDTASAALVSASTVQRIENLKKDLTLNTRRPVNGG